ncbi:MAG: hypothetical protein IKY67_03410 [Paludibacteraceae bacterium]|nr:hypothetical protein [Paludibacteraceae bacterium]
MNENFFWNEWIENSNIPQKTKLLLSIIIICIIGFGLSALYIWIAITFEWKLLIVILTSLILYSIAYKVNSENRAIRTLCYLFSLPIKLFYLWVKYMQPCFTMSLAFILLALYSFGMPFLMVKGLSIYLQWNFSLETIIFLTLSIGSVVAVHCNFIIHWFIKKYSPLQDWGNHKYESVRTDLALYVTSKNNIHFLISLAYVVFLIYISFIHIQYHEAWISTDIDTSIQKAFIVFIAFSTMMTKRKDAETKVQPLYNKIKDLFKMEHK